MVPPWAPTGSDDAENRSEPTLDDRPGLGGVPERQRRDIIVSIVDERPQKPVTIGELTGALSAWFEEEADGMVPTDEEIHSVLYDFDLPRLDSADRLDFDEQTGRVFSARATRAVTADGTDGVATNGSAHYAASTNGRTDAGRATTQSTEDGDVSAQRTVDLGVLLLGVAGVAFAVSNLNPFGPSTSLIPAAFVVLFFSYRGLTDD